MAEAVTAVVATATSTPVAAAPPAVVVALSEFTHFNIDLTIKYATLFWIILQAAYFIYDKFIRKKKDGS